MFVTEAELQKLTGYTRPSAPVRWLTRHGWRFSVNALGKPIVALAEFNRHVVGGKFAGPRTQLGRHEWVATETWKQERAEIAYNARGRGRRRSDRRRSSFCRVRYLESGARARRLVDADNIYSRLQRSAVPAAEDFAREPK